MNKVFALILPLLIAGCAGMATVEVGFNDEGIFRGTLGDIAIWMSKIELPEGGTTYTTIWEGLNEVLVPVHGTDFVSVTNNYVEVSTGAYGSIRLTVDSLQYIQLDGTSTTLVDTVCQFVANAFSEILIEEGDDFRLVVNIMSDNWFDAESLRIRPGHNPFEGAQLKKFYE